MSKKIVDNSNCENKDLSNIVIKNNARWVNFINANLNNCSAIDINLVGSNFSNATLINAKIKNSYLMACTFENANLTDADFENTDFKDVNLNGSDLSGANFINANLKDTDLINTIIFKTNFKNANFKGAMVEEQWYKYIQKQNVTNFEQISWKKNKKVIEVDENYVVDLKNLWGYDNNYKHIEIMPDKNHVKLLECGEILNIKEIKEFIHKCYHGFNLIKDNPNISISYDGLHELEHFIKFYKK